MASSADIAAYVRSLSRDEKLALLGQAARREREARDARAARTFADGGGRVIRFTSVKRDGPEVSFYLSPDDLNL